MKASENKTQWVKHGQIKNLSFIAKDIICYATGCSAVFVNLITGEETHFPVNIHSINGDGIKVMQGHRSIHVFAYAEDCKNAILYVRNYPGFEIISKFTSGPPEGYIAMAFSETSLLVTLGDLPNFTIFVWNWRSNEKFAELNSDLFVEDQILNCSWGKPISMVQLGLATEKLFLWDLFYCCKKTVLAKHVVKIPKVEKFSPFSDVLWTTEGGLYVVDLKGCMYSMDNEFCLELIIENSLKGDNRTFLCWYKGGIAVSGPNNEIRHYKKSGTWACDWIIPLEFGIQHMCWNRSEYIIAVTTDEDIVKISNTETFKYLKQNESKFNDFCLIYPTGQYIVGMSRNRILNVFQIEDGKKISSYELSEHALTISENPEYPYVAVGYAKGYLELISVYYPEKLSVLATFNLSSEPINSLRFFEQGRILVGGFVDKGLLFIIEGIAGTCMKIIAHIETNFQIVDYILVASKKCYRIFVIPVTEKYLAGNKIVRYCIIDKDTINIKEYFYKEQNHSYYRLLPTADSNRDRIFYALPFTSRNIHVLESKRGDSLIKLASEIKSGHQLRKFNLHITKQYSLTWGFDGFIIARDQNFNENVGMAIAHHRYLGGVKKAYIDPLGKYIVSLGRENILACTNLVKRTIDEDMRRSLIEMQQSTTYELMFKRPTIGFEPEGRFENKPWLEVDRILKFEKEEEMCREEKQKIITEFEDIKSTLTELVTKNLNCDNNEKIDLLEFYLDIATYNQKKIKNQEDCKETKVYLKALILARDKVSTHIMKTYWEPMGVKGMIIRGIFQNTMATNYTLLPPDQAKLQRLAWVEEQRKVEQFLSKNDSFKPWVIISKEKLVNQLRQSMKATTIDYGSMGARRFLEDNTFSQKPIETQIALAGTVSQLYIERSHGHYKQRQLVSFYQCNLQQAIAEQEVVKLKEQYNIVFTNMMEQKYREMENVKEKHARLRYIISEYNHFSNKKISIDIVDPKWTQEEMPWLITTVLDEEITTTPYVSPSEQAILDAKAAEEERIRLALLADDFRDRALATMMNGVLEIKWEDELKKEIPLPKCMLEKDPAQFNEEDLRAIRDYEEKVTFLNSERERYKNILDVEFTKVATNLRDSIRKFNQKVKDTVEYKMYIDSGMNQENLLVNRCRLNQSERIKLYRREEEIKRALKENEETLDHLQDTITKLSDILNECRTNLETLLAKEKVLEKAFKKDFQEASPVVQEQAVKLYRKRPRASFRQINTVAVLFELSRCVFSQEKSLILTHECHEYLKAVDHLDQFVGLPPTIDEHTYNLICKHRRLKLEYEIKLRGNQLQITDGEATIATFQRRVAIKKEANIRLLNEIQTVRADYLYLMHNLQTQIVLRRGLVEIPLTGDIQDFADAILVHRKEIEEINSKIKEAGDKKLHTIKQNMAFRRNIMATEWEHHRLRMEINDLVEQIRDINDIKFTREMQLYLKGKALGRKTDVDSFEQEVEVMAATYENRLKEKKEKFAKLTKQINSYKQHNTELDKAIQNINIDVCHLKLQQDLELEYKENRMVKSRMDALLRRSNLVQQIQQNHNEILVLQTELELLRLRTYPTFKYKLINNDT